MLKQLKEDMDIDRKMIHEQNENMNNSFYEAIIALIPEK